MEIRPKKGVLKKREVSKDQETLSLRFVASLGISEGNITRRGKKNKPTDYAPNRNSQWGSSPDARVHH